MPKADAPSEHSVNDMFVPYPELAVSQRRAVPIHRRTRTVSKGTLTIIY
ncbi:hypothetical protein JW960_11685 [candidate division KSB1 bacterium]|nr:hypothetical protein [candidate division KSB1 bacterium]